MTLEQEFQKQWTSLCNYMNSEIIKANNGDVDWNRIQSLFENEKRKWFLPGQYNNAWFEKLKRTDPEVAQKFEDALKSIKIKLIQQEIKSSPVIVVGAVVIGVVLGFGAGKIFMPTLLSTLICTIGGGVIGVAIGATIWSKKKNEALEALCSTFLEHLNEEGEVLARIISGVN